MGQIFSISLSCDNLINRCWDSDAGQAICNCKLKKNLKDLKTSLEELKERRNDVTRKANMAAQQNLELLDEVRGWLSRSEDMIKEVDNFLKDDHQVIKKSCLGGCCSKNYKCIFKFNKRVAQRLRDVKDLKTKGAFEVVVTEAPAALIVERPCDSSVGLEPVFNMVFSSFEENHVGIVGLYGKGGVGKTRLLTELNNKIGALAPGFDVVIWVVVSKGFYIGKVQDDIAKRIGLFSEAWIHKSSEEKATEIFSNLRHKKFILLLDDIWERVDLSKVGIPFPNKENGCKLFFSTRSIEICGQMRAHKKIEVQCLSEEKAWELFEEHVGKDMLDCHPDIRELAQEVAEECGGLPLALITIARAMASKNTLPEWEYSLGALRRSMAPSVFPDMGEEVYPLLKFSYDSLPNDKVRSCLMYCSLFSEDFEIGKDSLIDFWIGEGFFDEHKNINQDRKQGNHIIGSLLHACLLEEVSDFFVKMHDVIRDMCLWIASKSEPEKWKFFVQAAHQLTEAPEIENWRHVRTMSLMHNKIENLTEAPYCPDLQTLFLNSNNLKVIQTDFFQFMSSLKVLSVAGNIAITELPMGISKLVSLQYLDLSQTKIRRLPMEMKALEKLKCLDLQFMDDLIEIPRGLISGFSKLQVLRMLCSNCSSHDSEGLVDELQCLSHLNTLTVYLKSVFALNNFLAAERLHNCTEQIGLDSFSDSKHLNILSLVVFKSFYRLILFNCESLEEVKVEWEEETIMIEAPNKIQISVIANKPCFQRLLVVMLINCSKLRDITWLILAPNIRYLSVASCHGMEEIIKKIKESQIAQLVGTLISPFLKLKRIYLRNLPKLKSIYCGELPFSCMESIYIDNCPSLRRLPLNSNSAKGNKFSIYGNERWWKELEWEDESTQNAFLHSFIPKEEYSYNVREKKIKSFCTLLNWLDFKIGDVLG